MKRFIASLCISLAVASACGQGIVNLDFEGARVVPVLTNNGVVFIDAADALPGWLAFDGTNLLTTIPYIDSIGLLIGLVSSNAALSGNFSVALGSGFNSISQTGLVPEGAESLVFEAYFIGFLPCDGSFMRSIHLKLTNPSPSLATPAGLTYDQYNTDNALPEILNETLGVTTTPVRQVLAPQGLADIVTISGTEYEIRLYLPEDAGTKANGYYQPTGTPFKVWRVTSMATDDGGNTTQFSITEDPDGANIVNTFNWNAGNNSWTLNGNY